jgi:hypothetical protein
MAAPRRSSSSKKPASQDRKAELLQAYQDVIRFANEKPAPLPPDPPSRLPFWIMSIALIVTLTTLAIWQPPWLFAPHKQESPVLIEASLRVRIYSEIVRIERYQSQHNNQLPATLPDAGGDTTGVKYELVKGGYTLTGKSGPLVIVYKSEVPPKQFVGNSYSLIRARRRSK